MKKLMLLFVALFALATTAVAQNRTITGTVVSAEDDEPLVGATVMPIGGGTGTATDIDGRFSLIVPPAVKQLRVSYVGMHEVTVDAVDGQTIKMINSTNRLDEVMVVAYGTAKRSEYTGAASVVGSDQLQDALVATATSALTGKVSGVQTLSSNGQPGTAPTVLIRGTGSINASSDPLYVVDGFPYEGDIALINPQDIESMTVLKDAASTSLYGARGANGVIMITTKRAKSEQAKVTVDARWGANHRAVADYDRVTDTRQYLQLVGQALYNTASYNLAGGQGSNPLAYANANIWKSLGYQIMTVPAGESLFINNNLDINPNATMGYNDGQYFYIPDDWAKESFVNGFRQEYNLSVEGQVGGKLNYYLSAGYLQDGGLIKGSHFKRVSTLANVDYQAKDWLKIGTNLSYVYTDTGYPDDQTTSGSTGNAFYYATTLGPVYPFYVRDPQGNVMYNSYGEPIYDYGQKNYGYTNFTRNTMSGGNPVGKLTYDIEQYLCDYFRGKWYATINPIEGLNVTGIVSYSVDNTMLKYLANGIYGQFASFGGQVINEYDRERSLDYRFEASYNKTFANVHNVGLYIGYESTDWQYRTFNGSGTNLYQPRVPSLGNVIDNFNVGGAQMEYATRGIIVNAKYNYDTRYFLTVGYRRDASSRFAPENRWGNFFSVSGAWDIAKEKFMQDVKCVDLLKLRASFGQNGNDNLGSSLRDYYAYTDFFKITGANGVWSDGTLAAKGNRDITWETSNAFDIGVDFSFLSGRVDGNIDFYNRQTSDMLYYKPVQPSLGYSSIPMNIGSIRNYGLEIELNVNIFNNKTIRWDVTGNLTLPRNKVVKLHPDLGGRWISGNNIFIEGESMYQLYITKYAGVDPASGMALYWAKDKNDQEYVTTDASEAYSSNRVASGDLMPKGYGGFGTSVNAFGFDFSISFAYQFGGKLIDQGYAALMYGGSSSDLGLAMHTDILNAWTPENRFTDVPRLSTQDQYTTGYSSYQDRWLTSSNYLSLNNITLGYSLKKDWIKRLGLSELRVYGSAENVAIWSARKGLDPRQGFMSAVQYTYSPSRTIMGGIRVSF